MTSGETVEIRTVEAYYGIGRNQLESGGQDEDAMRL